MRSVLFISLLLVLMPAVAGASACVANNLSGNFQAIAWTSCTSGYPHVGDTCSITGTSAVVIPIGETDTIGTDVAASTACNVNGATASLTNHGTLIAYGSITNGPTVGSLIAGDGNWAVGSLLGNSFKFSATATTTPAQVVSLTGGAISVPALITATSVSCASTVCTFTVPSTTGYTTSTPIFTDNFYNLFLDSAGITSICTPSSVTSTTIVCTIAGASTLNSVPDTGNIKLGPSYYFGAAAVGYNVQLSGVKLIDCGTLTFNCLILSNATVSNSYFSITGGAVTWAAKANGDDYQFVGNTFTSRSQPTGNIAFLFTDGGFTASSATPPRLFKNNVVYNSLGIHSTQSWQIVNNSASMTWDHNVVIGGGFNLGTTQSSHNSWLHNVMGRNDARTTNVNNSAVTGSSGNYVVTLTVPTTAALPITAPNRPITIGGTTNCSGALNGTFPLVSSTNTTLVINSGASSCTSSQAETGYVFYQGDNESYYGFMYGYAGNVFNGGVNILSGQVSPAKSHLWEESKAYSNGTASCAYTSGGVVTIVMGTSPGATIPLNIPYWFSGFTATGGGGGAADCTKLNGLSLTLTAWVNGTLTATFSGGPTGAAGTTTTDTGGQGFADFGPNIYSNVIIDGNPITANGSTQATIVNHIVPQLPSYMHNNLWVNHAGNPTYYWDVNNGSGIFAQNGMLNHNTIDYPGIINNVSNTLTMTYDFELSGAGQFRMAATSSNALSNWISLQNNFIAAGTGAGSQYAATNISATNCVFTVAGSTAGSQTVALSSCTNSIPTSATYMFPGVPAANFHRLTTCAFMNGVTIWPRPGWTSTGFPATALPPDFPLAPVGACTEGSASAIIVPGADQDWNYFDQQVNISTQAIKTQWNPTANHSGGPSLYYVNAPGLRGGAACAITSAGSNFAVCSGGLPAGTIVGDMAGDQAPTGGATAIVFAPIECIGNACGGGCSGQGANCVEWSNGSTACPPTCNINGGAGVGTVASGGTHKIAVFVPHQIPASAGGRNYGTTGYGGNEVYTVPFNYRDSTCNAATWDTHGGGAGSGLDALLQLTKINGYDVTKLNGTTVTINPYFTIDNLERYYQWCFTIMNPMMFGASDLNPLQPYGLSPGAIPVFNVASIQ